MRLTRAICTLGGVGLIRPAPGTWGTVASIPLAWVIHGLTGFPGLVLATLIVIAVGTWAIAQEEALTGAHDASEWVIDETAGIWIALWPLSAGLWHAGVDPWIFPYPGWIGAFVMFRLFDIWKPGPVGWADRKNTPWGVMLDDLIAGIMAAVVVALAAGVSHGLMGQ